jgi:SAM-dependent methyltransferase
MLLGNMKTHPPEVKIEPRKKTAEQIKYEKMWEIDDYRAVAPGEDVAMVFLEQAKPLPDSTCIDFGCGTGRGALTLAMLGKLKLTLIDFAKNALDDDIRDITVAQSDRFEFIQHDLNKMPPVSTPAVYGYCTDVMEHLPPEEVDTVLDNILACAHHVFFCIDTKPDVMGKRIGETLHLTVQPYGWWMDKFKERNCYINWSHDYEGQKCMFYVSSWAHYEDIEIGGAVNTGLEQLLDNIRENAKGGWQQMHPHPIQDTEIMLIAGGPSLNDFEDEIIELRKQGMPMVTTNGTYNWAIERGLKPSMQMIIDARPMNKRFVEPVVDGCKYFIASQCDPSVLEGLPKEDTWLWHVTGSNPDSEPDVKELMDELYPDWWIPVPGGSTVTTRGLALLRMLGFHKLHVYGFDSCYRDEEHHAYKQPENNYNLKKRVAVSCGGTRTFWCDAWMYVQAQEFLKMIQVFGDEGPDLNIKGDGLIAHIIETGAQRYDLITPQDTSTEEEE